jgi:hypothetical protein
MAQTSAIDPDQQTYAERKAKAREARTAWLWRQLMSQEWGREFLYSQLLTWTMRPLRDEREVAIHNQVCIWVADYLARNTELYRQMFVEALKRAAQEREEDDTMRAAWAAREREGESDG